MLLAVWIWGWGGTVCPHFFNSPEFRLGNFAPGEGKESKELPQKLGGQGAQRVHMGVPVDARGGLGVSAGVPVGQGAVGWGWGVPGSLVGFWGRSIRSCRGAPRSLLGSGAGIGSYGGIPGSILAS